MIDIILINENVGWGEYKKVGTWIIDDDRRFCYLCNKIILQGSRVLEFEMSSWRGDKGHLVYSHIRKCP